MYRISQELDLKEIIGSELNQISLGKYDVQFSFLVDTIIAVQSDVTLLKGETAISTWNESDNWSTLSFQELLNVPVTRYSVPNNKLLQIEFDNGLVLQIHDNLDQYESFQITKKGSSEIIVV